MKLTTSQIKYLLTIYKMNNDGIVRSTDIASSLTVTRPSAHRMITQLAQVGLITKKKYSYIKMTDEGIYVAQQYYYVFSRLNNYLYKSLNLPADTSEKGSFAILSSLELKDVESMCEESLLNAAKAQ